MTTPLVIDSLEKAIKDRKPKAGLLFHSDQGVQYASDDRQNFLANNEIVCFMSRKGECYANAVAESFFASLKSEWLYQQKLLTGTEVKQGLFEYMETFYNRERVYSTLGYLSPVKYESLSFNQVSTKTGKLQGRKSFVRCG